MFACAHCGRDTKTTETRGGIRRKECKVCGKRMVTVELLVPEGACERDFIAVPSTALTALFLMFAEQLARRLGDSQTIELVDKHLDKIRNG